MQAIHGGNAKHDTIDAHNIAVLLRGGMLPQAYVSPAAMRATRDLLRRRMPLLRQRAARLAHVQQTNSQDNLPEIGKKRASKANRHGVADRFPEPAVPKSIAVELAWIDAYDRLLTALELSILETARPQHAHTLYRLQTGPGMGKIVSLVWLDEIHALPRCPRVQEVVSYCRLVTCAPESAGTRDGTSGQTIGNASRKWAFSDAAVLLLRQHAAAQKLLARVEKTHGKGKALTIFAHTFARVVYDMLTRDTVGELDKFLNGSGSSAGEPAASLDTHGISLHDRPWNRDKARRHGTRRRTLALFPDPARLIGHPLSRLDIRR